MGCAPITPVPQSSTCQNHKRVTAIHVAQASMCHVDDCCTLTTVSRQSLKRQGCKMLTCEARNKVRRVAGGKVRHFVPRLRYRKRKQTTAPAVESCQRDASTWMFLNEESVKLDVLRTVGLPLPPEAPDFVENLKSSIRLSRPKVKPCKQKTISF